VKSVPSGEGAGGLIRLFGLHTGEGGEVLEIECGEAQEKIDKLMERIKELNQRLLSPR